jgi:hypothetical protein
MQTLDNRPIETWDKGDHLAFALAGLMRVASRALGESLSPNPRGWVDCYPETLADDLEFWVAKVRATDVNADAAHQTTDATVTEAAVQ